MTATCHGRVGTLLVSVLAIALVFAAAPSVTQAQDEAADVPLEQKAGPDGMIGLGLIGAEIGMLVPAIAGMEDTWPYLVFPAVGAAGGAVAGIFLLQDGSVSPDAGAGSPEIAVAVFAVGLAGLIPALVVTMSAAAYDPETDEDLTARPGAEAGTGLVRLDPQGVYMGVPGVSVSQTAADPRRLREATRELSVSMFSGRF